MFWFYLHIVISSYLQQCVYQVVATYIKLSFIKLDVASTPFQTWRLRLTCILCSLLAVHNVY